MNRMHPLRAHTRAFAAPLALERCAAQAAEGESSAKRTRAACHYLHDLTERSQKHPLLMHAHLCVNCTQYGSSTFGVRVA
jgi:hypothetical protein